MAATAAGARLTRQHQQMQLQLRASAIDDWSKLWPIWDGSGDRFKQLAAASIPLVQNYHRMSAGIAIDYYKRLRVAEVKKSKGAIDVALPEIAPGLIAGTLYITGRDMTARALEAGHSPQAAMQNALVRTAGSLTRLVLGGGRDALLTASLEDGAALGYRRITTGTCDFCAELAASGIMRVPDFRSHDHCGCVAEPAFSPLTLAAPVISGDLKSTKALVGEEDVTDLGDVESPAKRRPPRRGQQPT